MQCVVELAPRVQLAGPVPVEPARLIPAVEIPTTSRNETPPSGKLTPGRLPAYMQPNPRLATLAPVVSSTSPLQGGAASGFNRDPPQSAVPALTLNGTRANGSRFPGRHTAGVGVAVGIGVGVGGTTHPLASQPSQTLAASETQARPPRGGRQRSAFRVMMPRVCPMLSVRQQTTAPGLPMTVVRAHPNT